MSLENQRPENEKLGNFLAHAIARVWGTGNELISIHFRCMHTSKL